MAIRSFAFSKPRLLKPNAHQLPTLATDRITQTSMSSHVIARLDLAIHLRATARHLIVGCIKRNSKRPYIQANVNWTPRSSLGVTACGCRYARGTTVRGTNWRGCRGRERSDRWRQKKTPGCQGRERSDRWRQKILPPPKQPLNIRFLQLHIGRAPMDALAGMGRGFHIAQQHVHFFCPQAPSGAHRTVAGHPRGDFF